MTWEEAMYARMPPSGRMLLMNLHALRIQRHRYGAPYVAMLNEFSELARSTELQVKRYQAERLRHILLAARSQSPYYRQLMANWPESAFSIDQVHQALASLPVLTKQVLRSQSRRILCEGPRSGWLHGHTSGTTGTPLSLWYSRAMGYATNAADRLQKRVAGIPDDAVIGMLLGRGVVPVPVKKPPFWVENKIQRQVWFSSLHMTNETLGYYADHVINRQITVLDGYPSTLYMFAKYLISRGRALPMRAVFSSSETLHDIQREAIQAAFQAPLFDYYGHAERAIFAIECEVHDGKHVVDPFGITEIVDSSGNPVPDGQPGFLTGTSLHNDALPLLRYRTGDVSVIDRAPCACGIVFPKISNVSTKAEDIIVLPDGRWMSPSALTHPFKPFPEIIKSQIVQESTHEISIFIVAGADFASEHKERLLTALAERLGDSVNVKLVPVQDIPNEASGKFRWVISRVPHELRVDWQ